MNALFVCSQNKLRSPTAEQVFCRWPGIEADSAGLNEDAVSPLSSDQIAWADVIFVMERAQRGRLQKKFGRHLKGKRVICLNIPDDFAYMDDVLVRLLELRAGPFLR
jgi:predicted protein tyrosine phosphatase